MRTARRWSLAPPLTISPPTAPQPKPRAETSSPVRPSATETLFALGLGEQVVAVTHECDFPPEAAEKPVVTRSTLPLHERNSLGIEQAVALAASEGRSLYDVDTS